MADLKINITADSRETLSARITDQHGNNIGIFGDVVIRMEGKNSFAPIAEATFFPDMVQIIEALVEPDFSDDGISRAMTEAVQVIPDALKARCLRRIAMISLQLADEAEANASVSALDPPRKRNNPTVHEIPPDKQQHITQDDGKCWCMPVIEYPNGVETVMHRIG